MLVEKITKPIGIITKSSTSISMIEILLQGRRRVGEGRGEGEGRKGSIKKVGRDV